MTVLPPSRRGYWTEVIGSAEADPPTTFTPNGSVVTALQAAWSAIVQTPVPSEDPKTHLRRTLDTAIGIGNDTDTVAAIAGALLGARWGDAAVPEQWRSIVHGWHGATCADLRALAEQIVSSTGRKATWVSQADWQSARSTRHAQRATHCAPGECEAT